MELDLHLTNATKVAKAQLAYHLVVEHHMVYPPLTELRKWRKEQLVLSHEHIHEDA